MTHNPRFSFRAAQSSSSSQPRGELPSRAEVEAMLREIAYVLKLTQRVKQQILSEQPEPETVGA